MRKQRGIRRHYNLVHSLIHVTLPLVAVAGLLLGGHLYLTATAASATPAPAAAAAPAEQEYLLPLPVEPPADRLPDHPLENLIAMFRAGKAHDGRDWVLPLLVSGLDKPVQEARITGYATTDGDGGGPYTRWGTRVRVGVCAADPRYWGPGSVIWIGDPINYLLVVEDTGGAIKGENRFDVATGDDSGASSRLGMRHANYVALYRAEPIPARAWGQKPDDWRPPVKVAQAPPLAPPPPGINEALGEAP